MGNVLSEFEKVDGVEGIFCARKGTLRCTAVRLTDDRLCVFSPVSGLSENAMKSLEPLGKVGFLLAPNHYHNKGLAEYAEAFPGAAIVAPDGAIPRLGKVTNLAFGSIGQMSQLLPPNFSILAPPGLKTGEIWISSKSKQAAFWIVVDAFCTMKENAKAAVSEIPQILGTFPKMGVANVTPYCNWVDRQIETDQPTMIIPCHGSIIRTPDLDQKLRQLMEQTFCNLAK